jgi:thiol-disulfide isomerase/thioredoxin
MTKQRILIVLIVAIVLTGFCLWFPAARMAARPAVMGAKSAKSAKVDSQLRDDSGAPPVRFVRDPEAVPPFLINDLDGNAITPANWEGKVTFIEFWATWCGPCREEIPELIQLQKKYPTQLQIIGFSVDEAPASQVKRFAVQQGINYPIAMATPAILNSFGGIPALPTIFVVSPKVRIVQKHVGVYSTAVYDQEIRALLGMQVDAPIETFVDQGQIFLKNATNAQELPDVDLTGLTPEQKKVALKRMNAEDCDCGCRLTLAQCRINDTTCPISKKLAAEVVKQVRAGQNAPLNSSPPPLLQRPSPPSDEQPIT